LLVLLDDNMMIILEHIHSTMIILEHIPFYNDNIRTHTILQW
jgi:hypothetical protein